MRAKIFDCPVDLLTMQETIEIARSAMRGRNKETTVHVALNVAKLVNLRSDPVLAEDVKSADIIGIDGMPIVWAAKLFKLPAKERVAGIDLFQMLLKVCADEGFRLFLLGASSEVLAQASIKIAREYPAIKIAGVHHGYFRSEHETAVVRQIRESNADCLFIGMPTPRKERFLSEYREQLGVPFIMGVGGSFDVLAGKVTRAPTAMQKAGLEWAYRLYQEPSKMWWRYFRTNIIFIGMMLSALIMQPFRSLQTGRMTK